MKGKIIEIFDFRTVSTDGNLSKTYVAVFDNGITYIKQRILLECDFDYTKAQYKLLKKYKNYHYLETEIAFKYGSLFTIAKQLNKVLMEYNVQEENIL